LPPSWRPYSTPIDQKKSPAGEGGAEFEEQET
jgi:hypothetical protein